MIYQEQLRQTGDLQEIKSALQMTNMAISDMRLAHRDLKDRQEADSKEMRSRIDGVEQGLTNEIRRVDDRFAVLERLNLEETRKLEHEMLTKASVLKAVGWTATFLALAAVPFLMWLSK